MNEGDFLSPWEARESEPLKRSAADLIETSRRLIADTAVPGNVYAILRLHQQALEMLLKETTDDGR